MAMSSAQVTLKSTPQISTDNNGLRAIPAKSIVAVFESRSDAVAAGVQVLVDDEGAELWCGTGRQAAAMSASLREVV